jgi:hypothetical protein
MAAVDARAVRTQSIGNPKRREERLVRAWRDMRRPAIWPFAARPLYLSTRYVLYVCSADESRSPVQYVSKMRTILYATLEKALVSSRVLFTSATLRPSCCTPRTSFFLQVSADLDSFLVVEPVPPKLPTARMASPAALCEKKKKKNVHLAAHSS